MVDLTRSSYRSWLPIDLATTPPTVVVRAPQRVERGNALYIEVDFPVGDVCIVTVDGQRLGVELLSTDLGVATFQVLCPTDNLPNLAQIVVEVTDSVGNVRRIERTTKIAGRYTEARRIVVGTTSALHHVRIRTGHAPAHRVSTESEQA